MASSTEPAGVKETESSLTEVDSVSLSSTGTSSSSQNTITTSKERTFNSLLPEIHIAIFSFLHYHVDATCLGLTSKYFWSVRKHVYGRRNHGKVLITGELAVLLQDWMGAKYCWDPISEVFLTKKAFEDRRERRYRKRAEVIERYGSWEWDRLVAEGMEDLQ